MRVTVTSTGATWNDYKFHCLVQEHLLAKRLSTERLLAGIMMDTNLGDQQEEQRGVRRVQADETLRVSKEDDESVDLQQSLKQIKKEMLSIALGDRAAFDLARLLSPDYVDHEAFLRLFLTSELLDAKLAASRLVRHFQKKLELFGPNRLVHPITLRDLNADDCLSLSSGAIVVLPIKDKDGRSIVVMRYSRIRLKESFNFARAFWFVLMKAVESKSVQNDSIRFVAFEMENDCADISAPKLDQDVFTEIAACASSLPLRVVDLHFCTEDESKVVTDSLMTSIEKSNQVKTSFHYGSMESCIRKLAAHGIRQESFKMLFDDNDGEMDRKQRNSDGADHFANEVKSSNSVGNNNDRKRRHASSESPKAKIQKQDLTDGVIPESIHSNSIASAPSPPDGSADVRESQSSAVLPKGPLPQGIVQMPFLGVRGMREVSGTDLGYVGRQLGKDGRLSSVLGLAPVNLVNIQQAYVGAMNSAILPFTLQNTQAGQNTVQRMSAERREIPPSITQGLHLGDRSQWTVQSDHTRSSQQLTAVHAQPTAGVPQQRDAASFQSNGLAHPPVLLFRESDDSTLSAYQCLVRQQIEMFEATEDDVQFNISKMSKTIVLGQVGIRCRHCSNLPQYSRPKAAVYYPRTLDSLYQFGQNMVKNHLCGTCKLIPHDTKQTLMTLQEERRRGKGGRERWAKAAREMGVHEDTHGLRFRRGSSQTQHY